MVTYKSGLHFIFYWSKGQRQRNIAQVPRHLGM